MWGAGKYLLKKHGIVLEIGETVFSGWIIMQDQLKEIQSSFLVIQRII